MSTKATVELTAEFEEISTRLMGVTDPTQRSKMLEEMRAILLNLEVLIQLAQSEYLN